MEDNQFCGAQQHKADQPINPEQIKALFLTKYDGEWHWLPCPKLER